MWTGSVWLRIVSYDQAYEPLDSKDGGEFFDQLRDYKRLKKEDSAVWC
jgi:hypothetical protein